MIYTTFGRTGLSVSKLGLGGAPLAGDFGRTDEAEVQSLIHEAIDSGINFIDTAPKYGMGESERRIGKALIGRRDKVILASKAVRSDLRYDYDSTIRSVEESLQRLQTDWIDILQLHDVETQPVDLIMNETVPALEKLKQDGKIRFTGVTTRVLPLLMDYMRTGSFDAIQFYTRYMLIDHTAKDEVMPLAQETGIGVINGSVLGLGMLADAPAHFLEEAISRKAQSRIDQLQFLRKSEPKGLIEPAMRFSISHPTIHVTLTGTSSRTSLRTNLSYCDGKGLEEEELQRVYDLFQGQPLFD
ncbi:aldo/keto reductase [Paenibacillus lignilyticus]|uniref:Aldo/keto reductase n=1 Tax=Paenibacillus lignilyticus TaxID=1172615 RepID=A0ABS5CAT9_9BACL|nr:aldo/keto reductase [Paenibacillus lignilyticus]MBP3962570.1 aldo/keto reductase [Paenibacillus lignilyticus]